ncbi:replication initiation protein [Salmonella enterica]|uniref:RepB family plasmid replication initiator protein n=2 Tax=Salmonella enterica I TaxID=59201 RepID=A0A6Y4F5U1_SALMU|nr:replication initiation protein [Salmonella enterica subsp. enterica serovar Chester]ECD1430999.1 RepB family plasmid replication initiator protein [Salmonella enterica subsp. enterica serovar Bareilly]ECI5144326.1 replication initiation protein [Salmonella enterica subsp. salamae]ECS1253624.1 replication initiation protein [Salmonella enterica]EDH1236692.1 RepB family plasmid replication initiator protein [Salmonella enterica subsp. enterica]HAB5588755.1 RepB family plasmid replication init
MNLSLNRVSKKTKIRHRNEINNTFSSLPLAARRILFMAMAQLDSKDSLTEGQVFRVSASEYSNIADVDVSVAYKQMKEGVSELQSSVIKIKQSQLIKDIPNLNLKKDSLLSLNLTDYCVYTESEGYIDIVFSRSIEPYITKLKDSYTSQVLISSVRLTDSNASTFYQYLRKKISEGKLKGFDVGVTELKDELGLYGFSDDDVNQRLYYYPQFKDFNKDFLSKNIAKISNLTEIKNLKFSIIEKQGRKASKLRFSYKIDKESEGDDYRIPKGFRGA